MKYVSGRLKELKLGLSSHSETKPTFNVIGISTFNGQIVGAATSNIVPFLYSNYSLFPSATTYHGAVAHAHNTGKLYYAHGGNWIELVSQETTGTVGTGTERYNIGPVDLTTLDVSGISTFAGDVNANGNIVGDNSTNISGINSVTATTFYGNGANLTGIDATALKDAGGNVKIQANPFGAVHTGISTFDVVSVGGTSTFLGNVGVGTAVATDAVKSSNTTKVAAGIVTAYQIFAKIYSGADAGTGNGTFDRSANIAIGDAFTGNTGIVSNYKYANISIGNCAGKSLFGGAQKNVLIGETAGSGITDGSKNVVIGDNALGNTSGISGDENFAVGDAAGYNLTSGGHNIMFGDNSGGFTSTGGCNVFIGRRSGMGNQTGNFNIVLGNFAGYSNGNGSNNIIIGTCAMGARLDPSNTLVIGHYNHQWIHGDSNYGIGIGITNPSTATVGAGDTQKLAAGIVTAYNIFSTREISVGENVKLGAAGVVTAITFKGDVDAVNIDVDGRADIDDLIVTGVSTFSGLIDSNAGANIAGGLVANSAQISDLTNGRVVYAGASGELQDSSNLTFDGTTLNGTFSGDGTALLVTIPGISTTTQTNLTNLNVSGIVTAGSAILGSAKVSDLTDNRVVVAGTGGELEDSTNLTFDGSTLSIIGDATFTGNVTIGGTLTSEDKTNIDSIGIVTARTGVRINSGGLVVTAGVSTFSDAIDSNNGANISGGAGLVASTAKISDLTSGRVVVAGTAGELEDSGSFTFSGGTVTATAFAGDGSALTGITASGLGAIGGLTIKDEGVVVGTAGSVSTIDFRGGLVNVIATAGAAGVATATITSESNPTLAMLNVTGVSTFQSAVGITSDLTISSTDTGSSAGPIVNLYRNSSSPADADYLGQLKFQGESDTGVQRNYAKITGKISDASNGTEDGILEFAHIKAGSQTITGRWRSDSLQLLNGTALTVAGDITANGNIAGDSSTNITGIVDITASGTVQAGDFNSTSDIKLKTNIQTITSPIEKLNQIDGVTFDWITGNKPSMGVIADTVEKVLPELVTNSDPKTVNYNGLIGLLIEAVKNQQNQITELKSKLNNRFDNLNL